MDRPNATYTLFDYLRSVCLRPARCVGTESIWVSRRCGLRLELSYRNEDDWYAEAFNIDDDEDVDDSVALYGVYERDWYERLTRDFF